MRSEIEPGFGSIVPPATRAPKRISPKFSTPSCCACIKICNRLRPARSLFAASSARISSTSPSFDLIRTKMERSSEIFSLAVSLPSSVSCQVFCLRLSPLTGLLCCEISPCEFSFLIARETFGGCKAQDSAIPERVTSEVTMKWSAWKSCSQRCRIILSGTGTFGLELWRATELTVGECSIKVRDLQFSRFQRYKTDILIAWGVKTVDCSL